MFLITLFQVITYTLPINTYLAYVKEKLKFSSRLFCTRKINFRLFFQNNFLVRQLICYWSAKRRIKNSFLHVIDIYELVSQVSAGSVTCDEIQAMQIVDFPIGDANAQPSASIPRHLCKMSEGIPICRWCLKVVLATFVIPEEQ